MLDENERDRQFGVAVTSQPNNPELHPINQGFTTKNVVREMMMDQYNDGWLLQYPEPVGVVIQQPRRTYFYRGESELYPTTMSSLVELLVADVKCYQFVQLIHPMENVRAFEELGVTVQYQAIAQHYGFKTFLLDITSDFEVALFFACCKFRNGRWYPLTEADIENREEKKYGLIFRRAVFPYSMLDYDDHSIFPIGYQPFIRCSNQTGFTLSLGEGEDLKTMQLPGLQILRFRHNPELSQWIYDKMEGGNKIYSKSDVLATIEDKLDAFVKSKVIEETALYDVLQQIEDYKSHSLEEWKRMIIECGYTIGTNPIALTQEEESKINQQLKGFDIQQFYGVKIHYRMMYNGPTKIVD